MAAFIIALAAFCGLYLFGTAYRQILVLPRNGAPKREIRAATKPWLVSPVIFTIVVGTASFLGMRWVQARARSEGPWTTRRITSSAAGSPRFSATPEGRISFVRKMVLLLQRHGLTHDQAILFTAHVARETGWGRWVYRNNFGNIKTGSDWTGDSFWLTDSRGFRAQYRAWSTPDEGIEDNIRLIRDSARYRKSWALLKAGNPRWYGQLGLDGYYEGPPDPVRKGHTLHNLATVSPVQREYEGIVSLVRKYEALSSDPSALASSERNGSVMGNETPAELFP